MSISKSLSFYFSNIYIYIYFMHRVIQREETTVIFVVYGDCSASSACC